MKQPTASPDSCADDMYQNDTTDHIAELYRSREVLRKERNEALALLKQAKRPTPPSELRKAIKSITDMLRNHKWFEHISDDPDVVEQMAQITALHRKAGFDEALAKLQITTLRVERDELKKAAEIAAATFESHKATIPLPNSTVKAFRILELEKLK